MVLTREIPRTIILSFLEGLSRQHRASGGVVELRTQVPTTVASVDISMISARWSFADLEVASPPGYGSGLRTGACQGRNRCWEFPTT